MVIPPLQQARRGFGSSSLLTVLHQFHGRQSKLRRDIIYSVAGLCREGSKLKIDYSVSDSVVFEHVLRICSKTMCLCSPFLVANALGLGLIQVPAGAVILPRIYMTQTVYGQPSQLRYPPALNRAPMAMYGRPHSSEWSYLRASQDGLGFWCGSCKNWVFIGTDIDGEKQPGYTVCFRTVCSLSDVHLFWNSTVLPLRAFKLHIIDRKSGLSYARYGKLRGLWKFGKSRPGNLSGIIIPLRILVDLYQRLYRPAHFSRCRGEHPDAETKPIRVYDPLRCNPSGFYLSINNSEDMEAIPAALVIAK